MKKRKWEDMTDDDDDLEREMLMQDDKDILIDQILEMKRKLMRMTEEMEEMEELRKKKKELKRLRKEMKKLKEKQRDCIVPTMNAKRVAECLNMARCIEVIYDAFLGFELKHLQQPLRFGYRLPLKDKKVGILASMPAFLIAIIS